MSKKINNNLSHSGSRARQQYTPRSDLDVIFSVSGDPSRESFYPRLIRVLQDNFPNDNVSPGTNYNVVHLYFRSGGRFDLVLLGSSEFDREHGDNVEYRRMNL